MPFTTGLVYIIAAMVPAWPLLLSGMQGLADTKNESRNDYTACKVSGTARDRIEPLRANTPISKFALHK